MLPVSDLLEVAHRTGSEAAVARRAPLRFAPAEAAPFVVVWNVGIHCNMSCPHCYAAAAGAASPHDLSTHEACALIDALAEAGVRVVILSGGEPLLRDDLFPLIERIHARGMAPQLSTNGVLIDAGIARRLAAAGVGYVGVSLDGLRAFNDAYRGLEGGFDRAVAGLERARDAGLRTGVRITLTRRNLDQIDAVLAVAEAVGAHRFYVSHLVDSGRGRRLAPEDLGRDEARHALGHLFALADERVRDAHPIRIVTGSNDSDGPFLLRWIEARYGAHAAAPVRALLRERGGNSAGERLLAIDHRGRIHPDQFWREAVLGDLRTGTFAESLVHPLRQQLRERLQHLRGRCALCFERELCRGSHRERALARHGDLWAEDPACVLTDAEIGLAAVSELVPGECA